MAFFLLFQQLFVTAFVTLAVSFLLTKFFLSSSNGDYIERDQKGDQETVKLNKVLKVSGTKSKRKRVRFVDDGGDQHVGKVGNFSGFQGSDDGCSDQEIGKVENVSGFEGSDDGICDHGVDKVGNFSGFELGLKDGGEVLDRVAESDVESGEVVEELGVEEGCEIEEGIVISSLEKSVDFSKLMEMVVEYDGNEKVLESQDSSDVSVEKEDEVIVDECVGVAGDDGVNDQSGEFEVGKGLVVEERSEGDLRGGDVVSAALVKEVCIEDADNEKKVGLGNDDVLEDESGDVRALEDLVSVESVVDGVIKQENVGHSVIDNVVISKMIENKIIGDDTSLTLASGGVVIDQNVEARVVEVSQETGVEEIDKGNIVGKGLVSDEDDDDWEGIERSDLEKVFASAANYVDNGGKADKLLNLGNDEQMQLYALHKIAMEGPCYEGQPMALKINARAKWNAWQRLGNMSPEVAMEQYVNLLSDKDPGWKDGQTSVDQVDCLAFANPETQEPINKQVQYDVVLDLLYLNQG